MIFTSVATYRIVEEYIHPKSYSIENFPLIDQPDGITCGPTSVAMLLEKYGIKKTIDEVKKVTKTELFSHNGTKIGGTTPQNIELALNYFGVDSEMQYASLGKLKYYVSERRPPIVLLRSSEITWHFVVVIGYTEKNIEVADPGGGIRYSMPVDHFLGAWNFSTDMEGNDCSSTLGNFLWFLMRVGEARENILIVPKNFLP